MKKEVQSAAFSLRRTLQMICSEDMTQTQQSSSLSNEILDSPSYFFVSTNIANSFPQSIASIIVQSHHCYLPGGISHKWLNNNNNNNNQSQNKKRNRIKYFTLTSIFITFLQQLGSMNSFLQKMIIHILQPIVLMLLLGLKVLFDSYPYLFYCLLFLIILLIGYVCWKVWKDIETERIENNMIIPEYSNNKENLIIVNKNQSPSQSISNISNEENKNDENKEVEKEENKNHKIGDDINNLENHLGRNISSLDIIGHEEDDDAINENHFINEDEEVQNFEDDEEEFFSDISSSDEDSMSFDSSDFSVELRTTSHQV